MKELDLSRDETYLLYGVSRSRKGIGFSVADKLEQRGYTFFIAHPEAESIECWTPVRHASEIPEPADAAILCTPKEQCRQILEELNSAGVKRVYAAPGAIDDIGRNYARDHGMTLSERCPLLHVPGLGFPHNLHRRLAIWFGS